MGLFQRFNDIITANLHDMVDRFEDPEKGLKQAVREMETSIQEATTETAKVLANQKRLEKEIARAESEVQKFNAEAEHCVDNSNDNGARTAIARAAAAKRIAESSGALLHSATSASDILKEQLAAMRAKLEEAKRELATLSARNKSAEIRKSAIASSTRAGNVVLQSAAFEKFDRLREKVEMAEAEAEALAEITGHVSPVALQSDIELQLAALKKHRQNT